MRLCVPRGINSFQDFFASRRDTHHIEKGGVVGNCTPTITYQHNIIYLNEHLCSFYNLNLYLVLCVNGKPLTYVVVQGGVG
jgi:hypothetical protein